MHESILNKVEESFYNWINTQDNWLIFMTYTKSCNFDQYFADLCIFQKCHTKSNEKGTDFFDYLFCNPYKWNRRHNRSQMLIDLLEEHKIRLTSSTARNVDVNMENYDNNIKLIK